MAITVKHTKVSTVPDSADTSLVRPSDWNADHTLTGLGTMAEQNANKSELNKISLKVNKLRNLIGEHILSIESDFGNIITADNIIDNIISSVSENTCS